MHDSAALATMLRRGLTGYAGRCPARPRHSDLLGRPIQPIQPVQPVQPEQPGRPGHPLLSLFPRVNWARTTLTH